MICICVYFTKIKHEYFTIIQNNKSRVCMFVRRLTYMNTQLYCIYIFMNISIYISIYQLDIIYFWCNNTSYYIKCMCFFHQYTYLMHIDWLYTSNQLVIIVILSTFTAKEGLPNQLIISIYICNITKSAICIYVYNCNLQICKNTNVW